MARIAGPEGQLLQENCRRIPGTWLEGRPEVEIDSDIGMVTVSLIKGCALNHEDVEGHHHPINGDQDRLIPLVDLHPQAYVSQFLPKRPTGAEARALGAKSPAASRQMLPRLYVPRQLANQQKQNKNSSSRVKQRREACFTSGTRKVVQSFRSP